MPENARQRCHRQAGHGYLYFSRRHHAGHEWNGPSSPERHREQRPDLKVLFHSATRKMAIIHHAGSTPASCCCQALRKSDLARMIRKAIDG